MRPNSDSSVTREVTRNFTLDRPETTAAQRRKASFGAFVGHMIEWYDYGVYGFVAVYIGANFLESQEPLVEIVKSFAVFAVGFFVRPLGGLVFGPVADRIGRRNTLLIVLILMSASTMLVGVLPTANSIGVAAPILLVLLRIGQGFSAGGEVSTVTAFTSEYAKRGGRGFATSLVVTAAVAGLLVGALFANGLSATLDQQAMSTWGWRLPFLAAGPLGAFALYIRLKLEDSPEFTRLKMENAVSHAPLREVLAYKRQLVLVFCGITLLGSTLYLVMTYLTTYVNFVLKFNWQDTFTMSVIAGLVAFISMPISGWLSDQFQRRRDYAVLVTIYVAAANGIFFWLSPGASWGLLLALTVAIALGFGLVGGWPYALIAELLPTHVRSTGIAISYNVSIALFGGSAPFIAAWLVNQTGNKSSPGVFFFFTAVITFVGLLFTRDQDLLGAREGEPTDTAQHGRKQT